MVALCNRDIRGIVNSSTKSYDYGILLLLTLFHGPEVVRIERVVLSYKDREHFPPHPLGKLVLKTVQWNVIIIVVVVDDKWRWRWWWWWRELKNKKERGK